jgi:hypothetical protein
MGMFEEEQQVWQLFFYSPRPELMLKIPGLLVVEQTEIYDVSTSFHD